jgi:hypothetical protein
MEWLSENWVWVLIAIAFVAMHMRGHGGHGGGGCGGRRTGRGPAEGRETDAPPAHRH